MQCEARHIARNLGRIEEELRLALRAAPAGSEPLPEAAIRIVGVSKYLSIEQMQELRSGGLRIFGENRIQAALPKLDALAGRHGVEPDEWHFIGSLQRNKAKLAVGRFQLLHGIDRLELAESLSRLATQAGIEQRVLLQVNASHEEQKHGFSEAELEELLPRILDLPGLRVEGLMGMAALGGGEESRSSFRAMRKLRDRLDPGHRHLVELSMGMSGDFREAAQEGASLLRIGTMLYEE